MIKEFQKLAKDFGGTFATAIWLASAIFAPFEFLVTMLSTVFEWSFTGTRQDGVTSRFEDPVYKNNLQRLIERNRQFEEERNERHS